MSTSNQSESEFTRVYCRVNVPQSGISAELTASPDECMALARRLGVISLLSLKAHVLVEPWRRNGLKLSGSFEACVVQSCVVSLDEFESGLKGELAAKFAEADDPILNTGSSIDPEVIIDPVGEDDPEILLDGCADIGELVVSTLAISLDPHPRKPGVTLEGVLADHGYQADDHDDEPENPFAVLRNFKGTGSK